MSDYAMFVHIGGRRKTANAMYTMVGVMSQDMVDAWKADPQNAGKVESETVLFERMNEN